MPMAVRMLSLTESQRDALSTLIEDRIAELDQRTDAKIREEGGPSNAVMTSLRNGRSGQVSYDVLEKLDKGLGYVEGGMLNWCKTGERPRPKDIELNGAAILDALGGEGRGLLGLLYQIQKEVGQAIELAKLGGTAHQPGIESTVTDAGTGEVAAPD